MEYLNPSGFESAKYVKVRIARSQDVELTRSTAESLVRAKLHNARVLITATQPDFPIRRSIRFIRSLIRCQNLGLALLSQRLQTTLQTAGLELEIGNLHLDAVTRPPLLCDFLTELKVPIVDGLVMHLLTTNQIGPDDFIWFDQICGVLDSWSEKTALGEVVQAPGIIFSDADNVIPDAVWISKERLATSLDEAGHLTVAPELIIEVLSPGADNERRECRRHGKADRETKLKLYTSRGVQDYWILDGDSSRSRSIAAKLEYCNW